jgi:uncharacterized membrane protein
VIIALSSVAYTTYLFFTPTKLKFYVSYALIGLTLASGTYLVVSLHTPLLSACETGLIYLSVVLGGLLAAHHRLIASKTGDSPAGGGS